MTAPVLAAEPLVRWDWVRDHTDDITAQLWEHLGLTAAAVGMGFAISMVFAHAAVIFPAVQGCGFRSSRLGRPGLCRPGAPRPSGPRSSPSGTPRLPARR